ncbi:hypothetical protein TrRE_jg5128 [Triparma retinervis]|uniref:Ubiquinone biosynthesis protein n=1 Tax=Triparma retinervis TaxID=2557542 RepID=A0A9W7E216_9STRA|nr:hypothetical protein TrRE_jg5128 [Triparma retinervis]
MTRGAVSVGLPPTAHAIVFEEGENALASGGGEVALVNHFMDKCNKELDQKVRERIASGAWDEEGLTVVDRYKAAVRIRLNMNAEYVRGERWHEAMAVGALPSNAARTAGFLNELTGIICEAGRSGGADEGAAPRAAANPVAEYGERAAVGAVYLSTELFMLSDGTPDFSGTWDFLDGRIGEITTLQSAAGGDLSPSDAVVAAGAGAAAIGGAIVSLAGPLAVGMAGKIGGGDVGAGIMGFLNGMKGGGSFHGGEEQQEMRKEGGEGTTGKYNEWEEEGKEGKEGKGDKIGFDAGAVFPK